MGRRARKQQTSSILALVPLQVPGKHGVFKKAAAASTLRTQGTEAAAGGQLEDRTWRPASSCLKRSVLGRLNAKLRSGTPPTTPLRSGAYSGAPVRPWTQINHAQAWNHTASPNQLQPLPPRTGSNSPSLTQLQSQFADLCAHWHTIPTLSPVTPVLASETAGITADAPENDAGILYFNQGGQVPNKPNEKPGEEPIHSTGSGIPADDAGMTICGHYKLSVQLLGAGSFCSVFAATDLRNPAKSVAVKVFAADKGNSSSSESDESDDGELFDQFHTEVANLGLLAGPRVVPMLASAGGHLDHPCYLVLERGICTLTEHCANRREALQLSADRWLPVAELGDAMNSAASCLVHIESLEYVYLDFKPDNLMLFNGNQWKLVDLDACVVQGTTLDVTDLVITPVYCPPELARLYADEESGASAAASATVHGWLLASTLLDVIMGSAVNQTRYNDFEKNHGQDDDGICLQYFCWLTDATADDLVPREPLAEHLGLHWDTLLRRALKPVPEARPRVSEFILKDPTAAAWRAGDRVQLLKGSAQGCFGAVRAVFQQKCVEWIGIELDQPKGKNDGSTDTGDYHFRCAPLHGIYVRAGQHTLTKVAAEERPNKADSASGTALDGAELEHPINRLRKEAARRKSEKEQAGSALQAENVASSAPRAEVVDSGALDSEGASDGVGQPTHSWWRRWLCCAGASAKVEPAADRYHDGAS